MKKLGSSGDLGGRHRVANAILTVGTDHKFDIDDHQHNTDDEAGNAHGSTRIQRGAIGVTGNNIGGVGRAGDQIAHQRVGTGHNNCADLAGQVSSLQHREGKRSDDEGEGGHATQSQQRHRRHDGVGSEADAELANQELADDLAGSGGRHQCGKHTAEYKGQEHSGHIVACGSHERPEQGCKKSVFRCEGNNNCAKDGAGDNTDALIAKDEEQNEGYDDGDAGYHNA